MKPRPSTLRKERAEVTRARLISSAEKIFARDGFEAARLEEIAAEAGYTRGAFYANFSSKEDLFFALLEGEISARIETIESAMRDLSSPQSRLHVVRKFFLALSQDRRWSLLSLEFKLFALRHPEVRARLVAMNRRLAGPRIRILKQVLEGTRRKPSVAATALGMSLSATTHALALEHMLDPSAMPQAAMKRMLTTYFDSVLGVQFPPNPRARSRS